MDMRGEFGGRARGIVGGLVLRAVPPASWDWFSGIMRQRNRAAMNMAASTSKAGSDARRIGRIAFVAAETEAAQTARKNLAAAYGDCAVEDAGVVVALGGDGIMLQTLERLRGSAKPVYGMHRGSVGFLMNDYR